LLTVFMSITPDSLSPRLNEKSIRISSKSVHWGNYSRLRKFPPSQNQASDFSKIDWEGVFSPNGKCSSDFSDAKRANLAFPVSCKKAAGLVKPVCGSPN
jgi:hypothetical protein